MIFTQSRLSGLIVILCFVCFGAAPSSAVSSTAAPVPDPAAAEPATQPSGDSQTDVIANSVVKIFGTLRNPDVAKPWTKQNPTEISGSGLVIDGNRILTNAHMVLYASDIQIQGNQAGDRLPARVDAVAPGIDLAVLKLDDESFFATHPPLKRAAELPRVKDSVLVYGYPTGGTSLSITKGIVSRIEYAYYNASNSGLRIQIDAAINHGNSGGPAMAGSNVIGLAFSFLGSAQNIGYIIPTEEIELMLKQVGSGAYKGRLNSFDWLQTLENPALRRFLKLDSSIHGMVVARPDSDDPAYPLKRWDVITQVGDVPVDDQGMIKLRDDLRVQMSYLFQGLGQNGTVPIKVARAGRIESLNLPVKTERSTLFPDLQGAYPSYFIFGPLVFSRASAQLVRLIEGKPGVAKFLRMHASPLITRLSDKPAFPDEELVFISSPFFPSKLSTGYINPELRVVKAVNGTPIKNLRHLVRMLRDSKDKFLIIEFADQYVDKLVFRRADLVAVMESILADNGVRSQGTPDTMAEWNSASP
jgi:S1-C subfamily serine protease